MGDDHGWDETAYNGHPYLRTPVLDEMASAGLRMDNFYSAHPTCSPTRGSVITGRHPVRYGTFSPNWSLRPEEISVAKLLGEAGYTSGHFGKWHLGPVKAGSPTNPGVITSTTSRRTSFRGPVCFGSSICSQTATRLPWAIRRWR